MPLRPGVLPVRLGGGAQIRRTVDVRRDSVMSNGTCCALLGWRRVTGRAELTSFALTAEATVAFCMRCVFQNCSSTLSSTAESSKRPQAFWGANAPCAASSGAIPWQCSWPGVAPHTCAEHKGAHIGAISKHVIATMARAIALRLLPRFELPLFIDFKLRRDASSVNSRFVRCAFARPKEPDVSDGLGGTRNAAEM